MPSTQTVRVLQSSDVGVGGRPVGSVVAVSKAGFVGRVGAGGNVVEVT